MEHNIFEEVEALIFKDGYRYTNKDLTRPWGGFYLIDETQAEKFIKQFFVDELENLDHKTHISPKILVIYPRKRLSWQYHSRRSEVWNCIHNNIGVIKSDTDEETAIQILDVNQPVHISVGERHRIVGLENYGVVAEIWKHSDSTNLSNEEDIIRLQDDFSRK